MEEDPDESEFKFGLASENDEAEAESGLDGPEPRVPEYSGREPPRENAAADSATPERIEPGTPSLESVLFVVLGILATLAAFALMLPFL